MPLLLIEPGEAASSCQIMLLDAVRDRLVHLVPGVHVCSSSICVAIKLSRREYAAGGVSRTKP